MRKLGRFVRSERGCARKLSSLFSISIVTCLFILSGLSLLAKPSLAQTSGTPQYPALPSETPAHFEPKTDSFEYTKRVVMIPMRDGVKLHTVILIPKGAKDAPILLTRTPYSADELTSHDPRGGQQTGGAASKHLGPILSGYDNATEVIVEGGYIRVVQDVRGKYGSEGDYVMNRPLHGPQNPTPVDHATDTYDTIDWLVKNIPESNGKVGILGISYDGFLPLMALVNPHPALKVSVPMNPMVDGWMGDDWFHNGAFRQQNCPTFTNRKRPRNNRAKWWTSHFDDYDMFMEAGSAGELGRRRGLEQVGFWRKILEHPSYDAFWRDQAVDQILANQPLKVPVMLVHSLWDQEDIYGAHRGLQSDQAERHEQRQSISRHGPVAPRPGNRRRQLARRVKIRQRHWRSISARTFCARSWTNILRMVRPRPTCLPVTAFETGTNQWRRLPAWPAGCASGCAGQADAALSRAGFEAAVLTAPKVGRCGVRRIHFRSGQARAVSRASHSTDGLRTGYTWSQWLVDDQREASGRPDVVTFHLRDVLTRADENQRPTGR